MNKSICIAWVALIAAVGFGAGQRLRIYLPAETTVQSQTLRLDQVATVIGDEPLAKTAGAVRIGQFSTPGQQLTIDRRTILSCLAAAGIRSSQVQFNGVEAVCAKRNEQTVTADRFSETARRFLENQSAGQNASFKLVRPAADVVLPNGSAIELSARLSEKQGQGMRRVTVAVLQDGMETSSQELLFAGRYESRRVVAAQRLEAGTLVTPENTRIEPYTANQPQEGELFLPYGMIAKKVIDTGSPVERALVEPKELPVLIKRQQQVILKIDTELMQVSAYGEAMEDGKVGDLIRVRRGSRASNDERFVVGRVMADGTVQPALN